MGWLELIPLLKRLLPLMTRVAPVLETFVATRAAGNADTRAAFEQFSTELREDIGNTTAVHTEALTTLRRTMIDHTAHLHILSDEMKELRIADAQYAARLEEAETRLAALGKWLKISSAIIIVLVITCLTLLVVDLLSHHPQ